MRRSRALCLLLSAALLLACQDDVAKLAEHLERGDGYVAEERFNEAIIEFKSALQLDPNSGEAHYKLAHAYFKAEKPRDGFWELRETVRLDPANHEARIEFSQLAILAGEAEEALGQMESLIEDDASDVRSHLVRGQALDALKRFDEANDTLVLQDRSSLPNVTGVVVDACHNLLGLSLARDLPVGSPSWKKIYHRGRNAVEGRNATFQDWGLKRLPVYGLPRVTAFLFLADVLNNLTTMARLIQEATLAIQDP